ncbi:MAG: alpha/beta fold hydrolase [Deltaproteobacteria bacterium]|nr:alpha/beta fold hydrolase [Deltaproteobacteria bacterium]
MGVSSYVLEGLQVLRTGDQASRPPLLLVHGAGHGAWCWEPWLRVLDTLGWEAHALSLRGHPGSKPVFHETYLKSLRVADYAADVATVARLLERPAVIMGHSMGGIVVQQVAQSREAFQMPAPAALVLLASVAPGQLGPMRSKPVNTDRLYLPDAETAERLYFHRTPRAEIAALTARIVGESPSVINEYSLGQGVPIDPARLECPVLSVTAHHDGTNVPRDDRIARALGGEWLDLDIGHDLMLDGGCEEALQAVMAWITRILPQSSSAR